MAVTSERETARLCFWAFCLFYGDYCVLIYFIRSLLTKIKFDGIINSLCRLYATEEFT